MNQGKSKVTIYFLCTGNSCRSQMAEGFGRSILGEFADVHSAGIEAHGLNPKAVEVMKEIGIDISGQKSSVIDDVLLKRADFIITLCGDANDKCPAVSNPHAKRLHWDLPDPAKAKGTPDEVMSVFRSVRDTIKTKVTELKGQL